MIMFINGRAYTVSLKIDVTLIFRLRRCDWSHEYISDEYSRRYDINCALVRNPCSIENWMLLSMTSLMNWARSRSSIPGQFTMNYDCFQNLILLWIFQSTHQNSHLTAQIATANGAGINGKIFIHTYSVPSSIEGTTQGDIRFCSGIRSPIPEVLAHRTRKMGEYRQRSAHLAHVPEFICGLLHEMKRCSENDKNDPSDLANIFQLALTKTIRRNH
jgi:hypothetical protein